MVRNSLRFEGKEVFLTIVATLLGVFPIVVKVNKSAGPREREKKFYTLYSSSVDTRDHFGLFEALAQFIII